MCKPLCEGCRECAWQPSARAYLARLGAAEAAQQRVQHGRRYAPRTFRYCPTEYHRDLVAALGANDEHEFKALKLLQGYASAIGV